MQAAEVVDYGVDWLTFTLEPGAPEHDLMLSTWQDCMSMEPAEAEAIKESAAQGYRGFQSRHFAYGSRADGHMFRVSSAPAEEISRYGRDKWPGARCTRIDFQTTTKGGRRSRDFVGDLHRAVRSGEAASGHLRRLSVVSHEMADGGDSLSVGSRRSRCLGRVYNKSAEQRGKVGPGLWRWEVECKREVARTGWRMLCSAATPDLIALSVCFEWFERHHIPIDAPLRAPRVKLPSSYRLRDEERRWDWLCTQVAPIVRTIDAPELRRRLKLKMGL